jgi:hypothetical protein
MALIAEPTTRGDFGDAERRVREELFGDGDATLQEPAMRRNADATMERAHEVADGDVALSREVRQPNVAVHVGVHDLERAAELPRRKVSAGAPFAVRSIDTRRR